MKCQSFGHSREGEGGMNGESSMETYTVPYVNTEPVGICRMPQGAQTSAP